MGRKLEKYIPSKYFKSVFEIDFLSFYKKGFRLIFLDIDNTLIKYSQKRASQKEISFVNNLLKIGFEVIFISNNYKKRVQKFNQDFNLKAVHYATKPFKRGYKKGLKMASAKYKPDEVIAIGDQLMTDIKGANKMGFYTILVNPLEKKSDVWTTKINRFLEKRIIKKIQEKHLQIYLDRLKEYESL